MNNKIFLIVSLFSLLIPIHFSSAVYTPSIGSQSNPIYIQVQQNPTQAWSEAWRKINSIQYVPACASIYRTINSQSALNVDMSDPASVTSEATYLNYLYSSYQSCVSRSAQIQNQTCPNGTGVRNGTCISQDKICEMDLGPNYKWDGTKNSNGSANCVLKTSNNTGTENILDGICQKTFGPQSIYTGNTDKGRGGNTGGCGCKDGYYWVLGMTMCGNENTPREPVTTTPTKTNDQVCMEDYGVNSVWSNTLNDTGGPICDCKAGYQWNESGTQCLAVAKTTTPVIKGVSEIKTEKIEIKENSSIIAKPDTANLNQKLTPVSEEETPKSFWARLKGWLGF